LRGNSHSTRSREARRHLLRDFGSDRDHAVNQLRVEMRVTRQRGEACGRRHLVQQELSLAERRYVLHCHSGLSRA